MTAFYTYNEPGSEQLPSSWEPKKKNVRPQLRLSKAVQLFLKQDALSRVAKTEC